MAKQPKRKTAQKNISKLYAEGFSKRRIALLEGISTYQVNKTVSRLKESTIQKHKEHKGEVLKALRASKRLQKNVNAMPTKNELEALRSVPEKVSDLLGKSISEEKKIEEQKKQRQEEEQQAEEIPFIQEEVPAETPEEEEKQQYHIVLNGVVKKSGNRRYTVLDDVNILTEEPVNWQDVRKWIEALGYKMSRTKALRDSGMHDIDIGIVKGTQYVSPDTIVTSDWQVTIDDIINRHDFHRPHSGAEQRKRQQRLGTNVSNPEYSKEFENRGEI